MHDDGGAPVRNEQRRLGAKWRDPLDEPQVRARENSRAVQGHPVTSQLVVILRQLALRVDLPDRTTDDVLEEDLALLINDDARTGVGRHGSRCSAKEAMTRIEVGMGRFINMVRLPSSRMIVPAPDPSRMVSGSNRRGK